MKFLLRYPFLLIILLCSSAISAQDVDQLKQNKSAIEEEIAHTNQLLEQNSKEQKSTLDTWQKLTSSIEVRQKMIADIEKEIKYTDHKIASTQSRIDSLENQISRIEKEISTLLRKQYLQRKTVSPHLLLLSAAGLNELFMRWRYFAQIAKHRKKLFLQLKADQKTLDEEKQKLLSHKSKQKKMQALRKSQLKDLESDQKKNDKLLKDLKKDKKSLSRKLREQEKARRDLNRKIASLLSASRSGSVSEEDYSLLSGNFAQNAGLMPWPVSGARLERGFGSFAHPFEKGIKIKNDGIDVSCAADADVKCIFEGEVIATIAIPGFDNVVMVKHGDYSTIYSKLTEVHVQKGEKVSAGDSLGLVKNNTDGMGQFHFEIWEHTTPLNPLSWLRK